MYYKIITLGLFIVIFSIRCYSKIPTAGISKEFTNISTALNAASAGDTIEVYGVITADGMVGNGIVINKNIVIKGINPQNSVIEANTSLQNSDRRVMSIIAGVYVTISNVTFRNGKSSGNGGAIENLGNLALQNCIIENNQSKYGGGIRNGIGGRLIMLKCIVRNNESSLRGRGINHIGNLLSMGEVILESNTAWEEGGGIQIENADASISNTTISGNILKSANISNGAGIFIGNYYGNHTYNITNSTISGNTHIPVGFDSFCGGGIGVITIGGQINLLLTNCTIAENNAYCGKGLQLYAYENTGAINLEMVNTIISNGNAGNYYEFTSNGGKITVQRKYSLFSDFSLSVAGTANINGIDPEIIPLANNGGFGNTHALNSTSPAINTGTSINTPDHDQRGALRFQETDIGAFEYNGIFENVPEQNTVIFNIFPNPCQQFLVIEMDDFTFSLNYRIANIYGKILLSGVLFENRNLLSLEAFSDGIYFLSITNNEGIVVKTEKIIVRSE